MTKQKDTAKEMGENAIARKAIEEIARIDREAEQKKREQVTQLQEAAENIRKRIGELQHQLEQVEATIVRVTGKTPKSKGVRNNHGDLRERVVRWMGSRVGEKFGASDLQREFPEMKAVTSVAIFLKKPIQEGRVLTERSNGPRSTVYSVQKV
jgi:hypothetical protein